MKSKFDLRTAWRALGARLGLGLGFALGIAFLSTWADAGNRVGNGGNAVICKDLHGKLTSAQLLDFYETDMPLTQGTPDSPGSVKSPSPSKSPKSTTPDERLALADSATTAAVTLAKGHFEALAKVHPALAQQFSRRMESLTREIEFRPAISLTTVDDSKHVFSPANQRCAVSQLAIRLTEVLPGQKRFVIDRDLWRQLPSDSRAGLLVHEVVYEYFFMLGETDSRKARFFTAYLFGPVLAHQSVSQYWAMIQKLKVPIYP